MLPDLGTGPASAAAGLAALPSRFSVQVREERELHKEAAKMLEP